MLACFMTNSGAVYFCHKSGAIQLAPKTSIEERSGDKGSLMLGIKCASNYTIQDLITLIKLRNYQANLVTSIEIWSIGDNCK